MRRINPTLMGLVEMEDLLGFREVNTIGILLLLHEFLVAVFRDHVCIGFDLRIMTLVVKVSRRFLLDGERGL
jgi:hypothetical protein